MRFSLAEVGPKIIDSVRWSAKWSALSALTGVLGGLASALFLVALAWATGTRETHTWLIWTLPVTGAVIGIVYHHLGQEVVAGNSLLLDQIHDPKQVVPFRMAPMILVSTVLTHLSGGSAGREGTAVQMGGTLADLLVKPLGLSVDDRKLLLMTGIAAGFGAVFGTPLAGAIFGIEVLTIGRLRMSALLPCLVASLVGDAVCRGLKIHHVAYDAPPSFQWSPLVLVLVVGASALFALSSVGFIELTHRVPHLGKSVRGGFWIRPVVGGFVIIGLATALGTQEYCGLSIPLISRAFEANSVPSYAFALKILFTAITLGSGFKGGEVTPLFCIGATLGGAFGVLTHQDPALFAALGFVAVFAGAANTPAACAMLGVELFGWHLASPLALACLITFLLSGKRSIYPGQRLAQPAASSTIQD